MQHQAIYDLAEVCAQHGLTDAVICPGSRSAPLVLGFANHPKITCHVVPDERSAGFIALGMAQASERPVVLVCTSGTAAIQFAAAVAEAFYQHIPLIVLSADRPPEWIGQRDGQTIVQNELYGKHVKGFFAVHTDGVPEAAWIANRNLNDAIHLATAFPPGPVHLNFPFREPLYPKANQAVEFGNPRIIRETTSQPHLNSTAIGRLQKKLKAFRKILLLGGQSLPGQSLAGFNPTRHQLPLLAELLSNLHGVPGSIRNADLVLDGIHGVEAENLQPDLLITWGAGVVSKSVKQFLRSRHPKEHWHFQTFGSVADTFQHLTNVIRTEPSSLRELFASYTPGKEQKEYFNHWTTSEKRVSTLKSTWLKKHQGEAGMVAKLMSHLPDGCHLHLANSMSVRYAILAGLERSQKNIRVFSNRGTSGIDGCTSTVVGHALVRDEVHVLITGDVAFLYDRNAFWTKNKLPNLHILVIQNHGGNIFRMIDGPKDRPEADAFFVGPQASDTTHLCTEYGFTRLEARADDSHSIEQALNAFLNFAPRTTVLEFISNPESERKAWHEFKQKIKTRHEQ